MDEKVERLIAHLQKGVPDLPEDEARQAAVHLWENDFQTPEDMQFVQFEDLRHVLSIGHSRKLIAYFDRNSAGTSAGATASSNAVTTANSASAATASSSAAVPTLRDQARAVNSAKLPRFDAESPYIPASVRKAMKDKKRPNRAGREDMVQRIVDHCREVVPGFQRLMLNSIALNMAVEYPATFKDTLPMSADGSEGLAKQMRDKYDNDSRAKHLSTCKEKQAPGIKEAFGCVQYNPLMPEGETLETLELKRVVLLDMHKLTKKQWKWNTIKSTTEESYYLQRLDINGDVVQTVATSRKRKRNRDESDDVDDPSASSKGKTILEMRERWPFLFTPRGMNYHFRILTLQDFRALLDKFIGPELDLFVEFMACKGDEYATLKRRSERAQRGDNPEAKLICLLAMLVKFFKETRDFLVTLVDPVTTFEEVADVANLPLGKTPLIVAAGTTVFNAAKYYVFLDNHPVAKTTSFNEALGVIFSAYYVFSIEYPDQIASLLIFIQRVIVKIDCIGSKSTNFKKAAEKVTKINNKFEEFKQKVEDEDKEV